MYFFVHRDLLVYKLHNTYKTNVRVPVGSNETLFKAGQAKYVQSIKGKQEVQEIARRCTEMNWTHVVPVINIMHTFLLR